MNYRIKYRLSLTLADLGRRAFKHGNIGPTYFVAIPKVKASLIFVETISLDTIIIAIYKIYKNYKMCLLGAEVFDVLILFFFILKKLGESHEASRFDWLSRSE